ncbi:hypothetical protein M011DRAFT_156083 [Sporormia fimetaria CBS 119925]|uniref:Uncharacterized protein n=1 Tax=Sporormia fimetaria CBS 119925 TaxID=1340428 RepID=A0A6A6V4Q8_9PLEO|nr:hypothetical protein M011DRAFT_156083 [Sporormia fimetaria CBS 119925]
MPAQPRLLDGPHLGPVGHDQFQSGAPPFETTYTQRLYAPASCFITSVAVGMYCVQSLCLILLPGESAPSWTSTIHNQLPRNTCVPGSQNRSQRNATRDGRGCPFFTRCRSGPQISSHPRALPRMWERLTTQRLSESDETCSGVFHACEIGTLRLKWSQSRARCVRFSTFLRGSLDHITPEKVSLSRTNLSASQPPNDLANSNHPRFEPRALGKHLFTLFVNP